MSPGKKVRTHLLVGLDVNVLLGQILERPVLDFPQFLGDLRDQPEIVGHNHHTSGKLLDGPEIGSDVSP